MNNILKTVGKLALPILVVAMFSPISVSAQDTDGDKKLDSVFAQDTGGDKKLEGSWNHAGTRIDCVTGQAIGTFSAMFTFSNGGTFWEAGTQMSPSLRSPSHGVWSHQSGRHYTTAFQFFRFNANGTLAGRLSSETRDRSKWRRRELHRHLDRSGSRCRRQRNCDELRHRNRYTLLLSSLGEGSALLPIAPNPH